MNTGKVKSQLNLDKKFSIGILVISIIFIQFATFTSYLLQLRNAKDQLHQKIENLRTTIVVSTQFSLWNFDLEQIKSSSIGILSDPEFVGLEVSSVKPGRKEIVFTQNKDLSQFKDVEKFVFPLYHDDMEIGSLSILVAYDFIYSNIKQSFLNLLFMQVSVVLWLIAAVYFLVRILITTRVSKLASYLRKNPIATPGMPKLQVDSKFSSSMPDEIDNLAESLNSMYQQSLQHQTELVSLKTEAERVSQMKTFFLASMSHELRTPLNAILGSIELIQESSPSDEVKSYLDLQTKAGEHLRHLIDDILDLTKIEAGELHLNYTDVDFHNLLSTSVKMLESRAQENNNSLVLEISDSVPKYANIDPNRLMQIIFNVVGNSCKFTRNGEIKVEADIENQNLCMRFKDTGIGIPKHQIDQIFQPFKQLDNSGKIQNLGAGIGLAVCRGLATAMKGTLTVESELGQGTCFTLIMPLKVSNVGLTVSVGQTNSKSRMPKASQVVIGEKPLSILVAEDTEENVLVLRAFLKKRPYQIDVVDNGLKALEAYKVKKYDLVLMDLQMPKMDGYEATQQIRQWEKDNNLPKIPIVALTAYAAANDLNRSITVGCDSFLTKPFKRDALIKVLDRYSKETSDTKPAAS